MMTSRERVIATLTFNHPDRAPRQLWALPYVSLFRKDELDAFLEEYPMDLQGTQMSPGQTDSDAAVTAQAGSYTDVWGSVWHVAEPGVIGEVRGPALADWSDLATFQPPWHIIRQRDLSHVNRECDSSDKFMLSDVTARPFERLQFLRGTENLFIDLAYGTAQVHQLLDRVHDYYLEDIRGWCQTNVDGVFVMDDWGTNQGLLINPKTWRELFKPLYKDYCDMIHAAGKFAFFHTDGNTSAIYRDLIEVGFNAINSQLFVMDIEELARQYKGKVTFWGEIDRQYVLPFGSPEDVRQAVLRVRRALDDGTGGVIGQCEWGKDNSRENVEMVFKTWLEPIDQTKLYPELTEAVGVLSMALWHTDEDLFELAKRELFTALVGDVMDKMGFVHQFLPQQIKPLRYDMVVIGRAMPVLEADVFGEVTGHSANPLMSKPFGLMFEALDDLKPNEVYVCTGASPNYALWGGLMNTRATHLKAAGAVVDGFSRDTPEILRLNFPTFSRGTYAQDQGPRGKVIDFRTAVEIGQVRVSPGDIVYGDQDGVLVIPQAAEKQAFTGALEKARGEQQVRKAIEAGMSAVEAFKTFGIM